jgi:major membrane immunogen (membrane-anchored lipoprotein)
MVFRYTVIAAMLLALLAGCAKSGGDDMKQTAGDIKDKVKVGADNVWSAQVKALDKAKGVRQTLMDAADDQRRAIEKESQ